jgi:hypothetical protein
MARTTSARLRPRAKSFQESIRQFLTPEVWKQGHQASTKNIRRCRWEIQPLVMVLVLMTWSCGESQAERFEVAKAFCVISRSKQRRPGKTVEGWQKALARLPMPVLRAIAAGVRRRVAALLDLQVDGFIPLGCDGSRLTCARVKELEQRLGDANAVNSAPTIWLTALVHLRNGVPWCWRWGRGSANERQHLRTMLPLLPAAALVVADAGYIGFELTKTLLEHQVSFLIRQCSIINVYTKDETPLETFRDGIVLYWPKEAQRRREAPLRLRLMCVRKRKKEALSKSQDVWLMTNVVDAKRLSLEKAGQIYRWRWENEGLFRTFKRTLRKMTFESRTVKLLHREAEGTMLALQLLLAQGALAMPRHAEKPTPQASPRKVLVEIRTEIQAWLPRGRRVSFGRRLARAYREQRERLTPKERRVWPKREPHKPPKPPQILTLSDEAKVILDELKSSAA